MHSPRTTASPAPQAVSRAAQIAMLSLLCGCEEAATGFDGLRPTEEMQTQDPSRLASIDPGWVGGASDAEMRSSSAAVGDGQTASVNGPGDQVHRVLLVIIDDLSADSTSMYADEISDYSFETAAMPTIEGVCGEGVRFQNAWSSPTCSATRAGMLTGRYGFRTGLAGPLGDRDLGLSMEEPTLPKIIGQYRPDVARAAFGKWHLGMTEEDGGASSPNLHGWPHFAGSLEARVHEYGDWDRTVDGVVEKTNTYATTANVDDTIDWLGTVGTDQPWVVWLAFNAGHTPLHLPPASLVDSSGLPGTPSDVASNPGPYFRLMLEGLDAELGRLMVWLDEHGMGDVDVIVVGDNGDPIEVRQDPILTGQGKGTVYQGGVHVPLCVSGPSVRDGGRVDQHLVSTVDLMSTILDLSGMDPDEVLKGERFDSRSLVPYLEHSDAEATRQFVYTEAFGGQSTNADTRAIRDQTWKLVVRESDYREELFNLEMDPYEHSNLLLDRAPSEGVEAARLALEEAMEELLASE